MRCDVCDRLSEEVALRERDYLAARQRLDATEKTTVKAALRRQATLAFNEASIDLQLALIELEKHRNHHIKAH